MKIERIRELIHACETEDLSFAELAEIDEAFDTLVRTGVTLNDDPENAMALDKLLELEAHSNG